MFTLYYFCFPQLILKQFKEFNSPDFLKQCRCKRFFFCRCLHSTSSCLWCWSACCLIRSTGTLAASLTGKRFISRFASTSTPSRSTVKNVSEVSPDTFVFCVAFLEDAIQQKGSDWAKSFVRNSQAKVKPFSIRAYGIKWGFNKR